MGAARPQRAHRVLARVRARWNYRLRMRAVRREVLREIAIERRARIASAREGRLATLEPSEQLHGLRLVLEPVDGHDERGHAVDLDAAGAVEPPATIHRRSQL